MTDNVPRYCEHGIRRGVGCAGCAQACAPLCTHGTRFGLWCPACPRYTAGHGEACEADTVPRYCEHGVERGNATAAEQARIGTSTRPSDLVRRIVQLETIARRTPGECTLLEQLCRELDALIEEGARRGA